MSPETRYLKVETYDGQGKVTETESIPYQVTNEELAREQAEADLVELLGRADGDINVPAVGRYLKALARLRR
ncbi:MAG: hypothetical protein V1780_01740 [Chloroflexota bacterium]